MTKKKDQKPLADIKTAWLQKHELITKRVQAKHAEALKYLKQKADPKKLTAGAAGSVLLLLSPAHNLLPSAHEIASAFQADPDWQINQNKNLVNLIKALVPTETRNLNADEEWHLASTLSDYFGFSVAGELDEKRLNRTYGIMGAEQHLYRYPGDSLAHHSSLTEGDKYIAAGIAPGLGAWGYFAPSQEVFTSQDEEKERWYLAVQTFLVPDYNERFQEYRDFFKYRKMLVVNPQTGQAVVAVIGDAGPAPWTGKQLGGSPEVMDNLGLRGEGAVLYFFVNDPENKIPLGPVAGGYL